MVTPATNESIRYQTIEQRRAIVHNALLANPNDAYLQQMLLQLCPTQQIQQAAHDGIFISYARSDEVFAIDLAARLRKAGINVWLDVTDISYDDDGDWGTEVLNALNRCGLMLMIVSREALQSHDLQREREYFINKGKIVLPVVYQDEEYELSAYLPPIEFHHDNAAGLQILLRMFGKRKDQS